MELIKMKLLIVILFFSAVPVFAQVNQEVLEKAFAVSYVLEKQKDFEAAAEELRKVYDQSGYEINIRMGWLYYNAGQLEESVHYYSRARQLKPYSEEARFGLILPLAAQGRWNDVIDLYNKILEVHPQNTVAMFRLGMIHYERKNYDKALPLFNKVVDLYPFDYDGLLMLAWTNYFTGNYNQAKILFNKVRLNNPGDASAGEGLQLIR